MRLYDRIHNPPRPGTPEDLILSCCSEVVSVHMDVCNATLGPIVVWHGRWTRGVEYASPSDERYPWRVLDSIYVKSLSEEMDWARQRVRRLREGVLRRSHTIHAFRRERGRLAVIERGPAREVV